MIVVVTVPFNVAVTVAVPSARPVTWIGASVSPAGMVTVVGTSSMVTLLLVNGTIVLVGCAALMRTVSWPVAPCTTLSVAGTSSVTCGGNGVTMTVAVFVTAPSVAVMVAVPVARPITTKGAAI